MRVNCFDVAVKNDKNNSIQIQKMYKIGNQKKYVNHSYPLYSYMNLISSLGDIKKNLKKYYNNNTGSKIMLFINYFKIIDELYCDQIFLNYDKLKEKYQEINGDIILDVSKLINVKNTFGLYVIYSSEKVYYVGQSVNLYNRIFEHISHIVNFKNDNNKQDELEMYQVLHKDFTTNLEIGCDEFFDDIMIMVMPFDQKFIKNCYHYDYSNKKHPSTTIIEILAILEQFLIDILDPELNAMPARKTKFNNSSNKNKNK